MGTNYHTPYSNTEPKTRFTVASMGSPLSEIDRAITYHKQTVIGCDGLISWNNGTLTWTGTIHLYFTNAAGIAIHNSIAAGSLALSNSEFAYAVLNETNDTVLTIAKAAIGAGSASVMAAYNRVVFGYRNASDSRFYPVQLHAYSVLNSLATAESDFLVGAPTPFGRFIKKTLAETKVILNILLTSVANATGFSISGGTTSKTLTVEDDSAINQDITTDANPTLAGLTLSGLTASLPVFTDGDKKLASKSIADTLTALGISGMLNYKGSIDCSENPDYPAADAGDCYLVSVAGKIGGSSGPEVTAKMLIICKTTAATGDHATVGSRWNVPDTASVSGSALGTAISGASTKVSLDNDDCFAIVDSEDGDALKKITFSLLKANIESASGGGDFLVNQIFS